MNDKESKPLLCAGKEAVAFELMKFIASEDMSEGKFKNRKEYYFKLYSDCLQVVSGKDLPKENE